MLRFKFNHGSKIGSEPVSCIFPTSRVVRSAITGRRHNRKHHRREQYGASVDAQGSYHPQEIEIREMFTPDFVLAEI